MNFKKIKKEKERNNIYTIELSGKGGEMYYHHYHFIFFIHVFPLVATM